ncbi:MAG: hypothetical protein PSX71_08770 [bacterium]|nr:hypothetical protein [bacterium]
MTMYRLPTCSGRQLDANESALAEYMAGQDREHREDCYTESRLAELEAVPFSADDIYAALEYPLRKGSGNEAVEATLTHLLHTADTNSAESVDAIRRIGALLLGLARSERSIAAAKTIAEEIIEGRT